MMTALLNIWREGCLLKPARLGQAVADVVQNHYGVYVIYLSNANYQNSKLNELMLVTSAYLLFYWLVKLRRGSV